MKKTKFNIKRKEIQKRIKQNITIEKKGFMELIKRASKSQNG